MIFPLVSALSAFLLFLVQPLIAKQILPWFGGSAAVWTTCMVFFQSALLAGYAYADFAPRQLGLRRHGVLHIALLLVSLAFLPVLAGTHWKPVGDEQPIFRILFLLFGVIGLPYFLLSATSPLVQRWFAKLQPGRDPYRLFAVSNAASLLALLGYPFLFEPQFGLREQAWAWSGVYLVFVLCIGALIWHVRQQVNADPALDRDVNAESAAPSVEPSDDGANHRPWLWVAFSAAGSIMLLATTNHLTENIASVPLMWLLPLTIYLLTFILTFDGRGWYIRAHFFGPLLVAIAAMAWMLLDRNFQFDLKMQAIVFAVSLFVVCMFCHGELVALKPPASHLTRYYLSISVGGALGAVLVGLLAPMVLPAYFELALGLVLVAALSFFAAGSMHKHLRWLSLAALAGAIATVASQVHHEFDDAVSLTRNFYGTLKVKEYGEAGQEGHLFRMVHGAIMHGEQYRDERWRRTPNTYYSNTSGVGRALMDKRTLNRPLRVGMIGLGVGTIAAFGRQGDSVRFYEINPKVLQLAQTHFTYIKDSPASVEVELGDARLVLERESPQKFDVLAVDAFSGDAIPVHLITLEAVKSFERHLRDDGILAFHTSNRFLNLPPILGKIASERKLSAIEISDKPGEDNTLASSSTWVLLARRPEVLATFGAYGKPPEADSSPLWTDDHHNLLQAFKPD